MAGEARDRTSDKEIKQLAFDIERTQLEQVGRMKGMLMLWDRPEQATGAYMKWMTDPMPDMAGMPGMAHAAASTGAGGGVMPGMATEADLKKLRSLSGQELDVFFLQLMVRHHQGGAAMAWYAQSHSPMPAIKALTNSILVSQQAEVNQMLSMLSARGAHPLPS
jgi:uncharacterized protein (DUF305 family)